MLVLVRSDGMNPWAITIIEGKDGVTNMNESGRNDDS